MTSRSMSREGRKALTEEFEGCELKAYQDGGGVWTIGRGRTKNVWKGDTCTQEQADGWLSIDLGEAEIAVNHLVRVDLTQGQFDALVDFAYNLGVNALRTSTLLKLLNVGDYAGAAEQFLRWDHDNGKQMAGLTRRRKAERDMFAASWEQGK